MLTVSNEYGIYLYSAKVDMRKGIDGLCGIVRDQMCVNPFRSKSIFVFSGRNPRCKKVLVREYNRFELISIRLDEGRFISPETDPQRACGKISWTDFTLLTEASVKGEIRVKYIDDGSPVDGSSGGEQATDNQ